ncbi:MAG: HNH endonuclease [Ruminococcus sp.]
MMIYNQADGRCVLCGRKIKYEDMTIDHIRPTSLGGSDSVENLSVHMSNMQHLQRQDAPGHIL